MYVIIHITISYLISSVEIVYGAAVGRGEKLEAHIVLMTVCYTVTEVLEILPNKGFNVSVLSFEPHTPLMP